MAAGQLELIEVLVKFRQGEAGLWDVVKTILLLLQTYILFGALLILVGKIYPKEAPFLPDVGALVIAVPVFIGVHRLMAVTGKLDFLLKTQAEPNRMLHDALLKLLSTEAGEEPSTYAREVASNCEELINAVSLLIKDRHGWAKQRYVQFVSSLVQSVVGRNAKELSKLVDDDSSERSFEVPKSAAELADQILEAQMQELAGNDEYCVISDLESWQGLQLSRFFDETRTSVVERGVKVRRLFNLMLSDAQMPANFGDILRKHMNASEEWNHRREEEKGGYFIRIIRNEDWEAGHHKIPGVQKARVTSPQTAHFGVFIHNSDGDHEMIRFRVEESDLSTMKLCRHWETVEKSRKFFEEIWGISPKLSENLIIGLESGTSYDDPRQTLAPPEDVEERNPSLQGL